MSIQYILDCKNIGTAIRRAEKILRKQNVYENFGQSELRGIEDKFIDPTDYSPEMNSRRSQLRAFDNWASNYTGQGV